MHATDLTEWIPIRLYWQQGQALIDWCWIGTRRLSEPFFAGTVEQCLRLPFNLAFRRQTPIDVLLDWQARQPGVPPAGFIFHMSRCGSTLVSQMLAALPQHVVISEATPLDTVLTAPLYNPNLSDEQRIGWLRGLISAWGQRRTGSDRRSFVKFGAWHVMQLPLLHAAFPHTPWIFLYREPVEVMVSTMRERGSLSPGPIECAKFRFDLLQAVQWSDEEFCARALAQILQAAFAHRAVGRGLFVNYRQLPGAVGTCIAGHFGLEQSSEDRDLLHGIAKHDAKSPDQPFAGDTQDKQRAATPQIRAMTEQWLRAPYEALSQIARAGDVT